MGKFAILVDTLEGVENFKAWYNIPARVSIQHCLQGEWHAWRSEGEVVIPIVAFIEGRMRIPMGRVTKDFLIVHRLCPTQCTPSIFRMLGSVDALKKKMGVHLTHQDVNWVYNCQLLKNFGYYLKTRVPAVRLNCPTQDRIPGGALWCRFLDSSLTFQEPFCPLHFCCYLSFSPSSSSSFFVVFPFFNFFVLEFL